MPDDAEQVTLLDGSSPQARVFERTLVVAGPFAPGRDDRAGRIPPADAGARRDDRAAAAAGQHGDQRGPAALGETRLAEPTLPQSREAQAEGRKLLHRHGPGALAGQPLTLVVDGLPHHRPGRATPRWGWPALIAVGGL